MKDKDGNQLSIENLHQMVVGEGDLAIMPEGCMGGGDGRPKKPGRSFCYVCYKSLPREMQSDLYRHVGDGYGEAYDKAVEWLEG